MSWEKKWDGGNLNSENFFLYSHFSYLFTGRSGSFLLKFAVLKQNQQQNHYHPCSEVL